MLKFSTSPRAFFHSFISHRSFLYLLIKRDIESRYKGSFLGFLWAMFTPAFLLCVYTFVFSLAFKARWGNPDGSKGEFALVLFVGMIVFNLFSECLNRAPQLIIAHTNYVKRVVFPLELLPLMALGTAYFNAFLSLAVWLAGYIIICGPPHVQMLLIPIVLMPLGLLSLGITYFLSSLGVFLRDLSQLMGVITTVLMFLSPIFYPLAAIPEKYRFILHLSPLTPVLGWARGVLYWQKLPDPWLFTAFLSVSLVIFCLGFAWFQKTRKGFADVL